VPRKREIEDQDEEERAEIFARTPQAAKNLTGVMSRILVLSKPVGMGEEYPAVRAGMIEKLSTYTQR
jgi:hypothetical protein